MSYFSVWNHRSTTPLVGGDCFTNCYGEAMHPNGDSTSRLRTAGLIVGALIVLGYLAMVAFEMYNEGFLPFGPQR